MKARQYINMMGMAAAVLLSSCVKDTLYDTPHPDKGAVTISLTGLSADDNYVLDMDGKVADITGSPFTNPDLLNPGTHSMVIYNRAEVSLSTDEWHGSMPLMARAVRTVHP